MSAELDLVVHLHEGPWTEEAFFALPEDPRVELLDGALLVSPYASMGHQRLSSRLWFALERARPAGVEVFVTINVRLAPGRILIPDVVVVADPPQDAVATEASSVLLALEIASPGNAATDRAIKPGLYAEAGIPVYVRIELAGPTAHVYRLRKGGYQLVESGTVLRLAEPFPVEIDLAALLAAERID